MCQPAIQFQNCSVLFFFPFSKNEQYLHADGIKCVSTSNTIPNLYFFPLLLIWLCSIFFPLHILHEYSTSILSILNSKNLQPANQRRLFKNKKIKGHEYNDPSASQKVLKPQKGYLFPNEQKQKGPSTKAAEFLSLTNLISTQLKVIIRYTALSYIPHLCEDQFSTAAQLFSGCSALLYSLFVLCA